MTGRTQMPEPAVAQHVIRPGSKELTVKALLTALSPRGNSLSLHSFLCRALLYTVCLVIVLQLWQLLKGGVFFTKDLLGSTATQSTHKTDKSMLLWNPYTNSV